MGLNRKNKNSNKDNGNSWTSYSDLFTSLAVVFLVMFVFALIKAAVNNVKLAKTKKETKEYLQGKVPENLKKEVAQKELQIEKSIEQIDQYDEIIDQKMKDLNKLVKNLSKQKKLMKDLLADKRDKEVILNDITKVVTKKSSQIQEMDQVIKQYEVQKKQIVDQKNNINQKMVSLQKEYEKMVNERNLQKESIKYLENNNNKQKLSLNEYKSMTSVLSKKINDYQKQAENAQNKISKLEEKNKNYENEIEKLAKDFNQQSKKLQKAKTSLAASESQLAKQNQLVQTLQAEMNDIKGSFNELKSQYASAKKNYESKNANLDSTVQNLEGQLSSLDGEHAKLQGQYQDLKGKLGQLKSEYANAKGMYENQGKALKNELKGLQKQLADSNSRKIASVQNSIRENIAESLAKRFRESNIPVVVDKRTGNIVFQMDDLFLFKNNSAELTDSIKEKLKKIIPIYADELLGKPEIAQHILRINIEGHASPTFNQAFVDPMKANPWAYGYNLELSTKRATQLVQYIFGPKFKPFPYQSKMRVMTNAVGYSFSQAIKKDQSTEDCGSYDCAKSRRVIISFTLNNNKMIIDAFEKQKALSINTNIQ